MGNILKNGLADDNCSEEVHCPASISFFSPNTATLAKIVLSLFCQPCLCSDNSLSSNQISEIDNEKGVNIWIHLLSLLLPASAFLFLR